jgi:multicomponent Na+:H+ antiporter subunit G
MSDYVGYLCIVVGLVFDIFGCIGLIRLPDVYNRLQATTKCVTLGTCSILLGTLVIKGLSATGIKAFLCILFLILTSPASAHALSRGAYISGVKLWSKSVCDKYAQDQEASGQ